MERSDGRLSDGGRPLLGNIYLVIFVYQGWFTPLPTPDPQLDITSMSMGPDTSLDRQMYMNYLVSRARAATAALQSHYTNKSLHSAYRDHWMAKIMEELVSLVFSLPVFLFWFSGIGAWVHLHWKMSDGKWISLHPSILHVPLQNPY